VEEPLFIRRALLVEMASRTDATMSGMDAATVKAVKDAAKAPGDDTAKADAIAKVLSKMTMGTESP
jgi:hypothetical protein